MENVNYTWENGYVTDEVKNITYDLSYLKNYRDWANLKDLFQFNWKREGKRQA